MSNTPTKIDAVLPIVYKVFDVLDSISPDITAASIHQLKNNKLGFQYKNKYLYTDKLILRNIKIFGIPENYKAEYDEIQEKIRDSLSNISLKKQELDCLTTEITSKLESINSDLIEVFNEMIDAFHYHFGETFRVCNDTYSRVFIKSNILSNTEQDSLLFFTQSYINSCLEKEELEHDLIDKSIRKFEDSKLGFLTILNFLNKKINLVI